MLMNLVRSYFLFWPVDCSTEPDNNQKRRQQRKLWPAKTEKNMKISLRHTFLLGAIAAFAGSIYATPTLYLESGGTWVTVVDNGSGDVNPTTGQVTWVGTIGNWTLNVDTGTTFPALGSLTAPQMDLAFSANSSGSGGALWIYFSADGFGPTNSGINASLGGTSTGMVTFYTYGGSSNTLVDTSNALAIDGPLGGPSFSGNAAGGMINSAGLYSLTDVISINAAGAGYTSGDAILSVPDGGTMALLLGLGLVGLSMFAGWRKVATA